MLIEKAAVRCVTEKTNSSSLHMFSKFVVFLGTKSMFEIFIGLFGVGTDCKISGFENLTIDFQSCSVAICNQI